MNIIEEITNDELLARLLGDDGCDSGAWILRRKGGEAPLSFAQQRLWMAAHVAPEPSLYNLPSAIRLRGPLDVGALEESLAAMVERHESLRTAFLLEDDEPTQVVFPAHAERLRVIAVADGDALRLRVREEALRPFDLGSGRPFRALLIRMASDEHVLVATMHHIVSDAGSLAVFWRELAALYGVCMGGEPSPLAELPVQYADYAEWERERLAGDALDASVDHWRRKFTPLPLPLRFSDDHARPRTSAHCGGRASIELSTEAIGALRELARKESATLFMALLAVFEVLLHGSCGSSDIVVGSPISARDREEIEPLIGFFVNMLPLRTDLSGEPSFLQVLHRVRRTCIDAFAHQCVPFEKIVETVAPRRQAAHPIFQIVFALLDAEALPRFAGLDAEVEPVEMATSKFDLMLEVEDGRDRVRAHVTYSTERFEASTIARLLEDYATLVLGLVSDPDRSIETVFPNRLDIHDCAEVDGGADRFPSNRVPHRDPRNETERTIATIWSDLLGVGRVGVDHNFFDLGGHSLLATRAVSRACKAFGVALPLRALFDEPTIASMATAIDAIRAVARHLDATPRAATAREEFTL